MPLIHKAGPLIEGVQRCSRCGVVLTDYRNAMVPDGSPPLRGFPVDASVEVFDGGPRGMGVTVVKPNCRK